jgi:hypothetical protein
VSAVRCGARVVLPAVLPYCLMEFPSMLNIRDDVVVVVAARGTPCLRWPCGDLSARGPGVGAWSIQLLAARRRKPRPGADGNTSLTAG